MPTSVRVQPQGFQVQYPRTSWRVSYVEELSGKFRFVLSGRDFQFEPRDKYRYPTHDDAKRAAFCFLELMKRLERSRQRLGILALVWGAEVFPADVPFLSDLAFG